jgi:hypothetical protein
VLDLRCNGIKVSGAKHLAQALQNNTVCLILSWPIWDLAFPLFEQSSFSAMLNIAEPVSAGNQFPAIPEFRLMTSSWLHGISKNFALRKIKNSYQYPPIPELKHAMSINCLPAYFDHSIPQGILESYGKTKLLGIPGSSEMKICELSQWGCHKPMIQREAPKWGCYVRVMDSEVSKCWSIPKCWNSGIGVNQWEFRSTPNRFRTVPIPGISSRIWCITRSDRSIISPCMLRFRNRWEAVGIPSNYDDVIKWNSGAE